MFAPAPTWDALLDQGAAQRPYPIELRLAAPATHSALQPLLQLIPEVLRAEPWSVQRASWVDGQGLAVSRTYPDGGHGQLLLRLVPPGGTLQHTTAAEGRWLQGESDLAVNQAAAALLDHPARIGDTLSLVVGDSQLKGRLVGRIEEPMTAPTVYHFAPADAAGSHWRLQLAPGNDAQAVAKRLVAAASGLGLPAARAVTEQDLRLSAAGHLLVLQRSLAWVAFGTGLVGMVALASALGSSVAERRREWAVLHALGAPDRLLAATVVAEALLVVLLSLAGACAAGALLDPLVAARLGEISGQPLRARAAGLALPLWALLATAAGLLASVGAARQAIRGRQQS